MFKEPAAVSLEHKKKHITDFSFEVDLNACRGKIKNTQFLSIFSIKGKW